MPPMLSIGTTQTGRGWAMPRFEWVVVASILALGMGATVYPHRLVNWHELGIRFEWVRLLVLALLYLALGIAMLKSRLARAVGNVLRQAPALSVLLLLELASTAWSIDRTHTLSRSVVLSSTAFVGLYIGLRYEVDEILTLLIVIVATLATVTVIGMALSTAVSMEPTVAGAWRGPFEHKNYLGRSMLIGCVALLLKLASTQPSRTARFGLWAMVPLLATALLLSRSATAQLLAVIALGLSLYLPYLLRSTTRRDYAVAIAGGVLGAGLGAAALWYPADTLSLLGKDITLTGRLEVWNVLLPYVSRGAWLGYGYHAFWGHFRGSIEHAIGWTSVVEAYNGYIELVLDCGVLGLLLFAVALVSTFDRSVRFYRRNPQRKNLFPILALFCFATLNLVGSHLARFDDFWWMLFWIVVALTSEEGSRHRVGPALGKR
jgi:exopolysaccharide production protein ExoQ